MLLNSVGDLERGGDKTTGQLDHVNVSQNEPGLGTFRVQTTLKAPDQTEVRVVVQTLGVVGEGVVKESIRGSIRHEGRDIQTLVQG